MLKAKKLKFPSKVRGGPLVGSLLLLILSGCSGQLVCTWQSEDEQLEKILHEVEHATQKTLQEELKKTVEPIQQ